MNFQEGADMYLNPPIRARFLANIVDQFGKRGLRTLTVKETLVGGAFSWIGTPEGSEYWSMVNDTHRDRLYRGR